MNDHDGLHTDVEPVDPASDSASDETEDALLSRLRVIEDQPLEMRAETFQQLHDELQRMLDSGSIEPRA